MKRITRFLILLTLISIIGFKGCLAYANNDGLKIVRSANSIELIDVTYSVSISDCQKAMPLSNGSNYFRPIRHSARTEFIANGGLEALKNLCAKHGQNLVVYSIAAAKSGEIVAASLVFPQKDETDSCMISDHFLKDSFSILKEHKLCPITDDTPYIIFGIVLKSGRDSMLYITSDSTKIEVFSNPKYNTIDSYKNNILESFKSPDYNNHDIYLAEMYRVYSGNIVKETLDSFGVKALSGTFVINSYGELEAVSFRLSKYNNGISTNRARLLYEKLRDSLVFTTWNTKPFFACLTIRLDN